MEGIDYEYGQGVSADQIKKAGKSFVCRYLSGTVNPSKDINKKELDNLLHAGLAVVVVWETSNQRASEGAAAGHTDAETAEAQVKALGIGGIPIYFSGDWDFAAGQQGNIDAYLGACAAVIGKARVGLYSGYWPMKRAFEAGKITYGWQTTSWSGKNRESRAHIQQYAFDQKLPGTPHLFKCDFDRTTPAGERDFGQWPRPKK